MISAAAFGVALERSGLDPEWEAFVEATSQSPLQSGRWAEVKSVVGWGSARVVVRQAGRIVGGCQLLLRRLRRWGAIGYVPHGPLTKERDPRCLDAVLRGLSDLARAQRAVYLKVQPPPGRHDMVATLEAHGYVRSGLEGTPTATVRVPLYRSPTERRAAMRRNIRNNIRDAERAGVVVRAGGEADLAAFHSQLEATAERQGFSAYPAGYYRQMWRSFAPDGRLLLLLAEHEGRLVSSLLMLGYGDTATCKAAAWSGERSRIRPNELSHWRAMEEARRRGYRYYDFDGIEPWVAVELAAGRKPPTEALPGVTHFKLGFGGETVMFPGAYDRAWHPVLTGGLRLLAPRLDRWQPLAQRVLRRARG